MKTEFIQTPPNWKSFQPHPIAKAASFIDEDRMEGVAEFYKSAGYDQNEPIIIIRNGKTDEILDGILRHRAAIMAGIVPSFRRFTGDNPKTFVAKKAFRQHLSTSQRAMIAALIANAPVGNPAKSQDSTTISLAAKTLNVGERAVADANKVIKEGTEELQDAVKDGTVTVSDAVKVVNEPPAVQNEAVKRVRKKKAKTVSEAVESEPEPEPVDENGVLWKEKAPKALKALAAEKQIREMSRIMAKFMKMLGGDESLHLYTYSMQSVVASLKTVKETLLGALPSYVCPYCDGTCKTLEGAEKGKACEVCQRQGWVTRSVYRRSPKGQAK